LLVELLALPVDLFKDSLAEQFGFAATLAKPNPSVFSK
jgi:hypothetical protein